MEGYTCGVCGAPTRPAEVGSVPLDAVHVARTCDCTGPIAASLEPETLKINLSQLLSSVSSGR